MVVQYGFLMVALLCDLIIATDQSFFVKSFSNIGLISDLAAIHFLPMLLEPMFP